MIELTRLNGHALVLNAELIKIVEQSPDTVVTLITGDKLVVREPAAEITRRVLEYRRCLLHPEAPMPLPAAALSNYLLHSAARE